jgi:hypothetical protein
MAKLIQLVKLFHIDNRIANRNSLTKQ